MHHCHDCHDNKRFLPVCQVRLSCQHPGAVALLRHRLSPPFPAFPHLSPPFPAFHLGSAVATPPFARYDYLPKYIRKQSIARPFAADDASMLAIQAVADAADRAARAALPPPPPPSAAAARRAWGLSYACGVRDCHRLPPWFCCCDTAFPCAFRCLSACPFKRCAAINSGPRTRSGRSASCW